MRLIKQGDGILRLPNVEQKYTGNTDVWAGSLYFDGKLLQSSLWLNRFAELHTNGGEFRRIKMDYAAKLLPGGENNTGTVTTDSLMLGFGSRVVFDLNPGDMSCDQVNAKRISIETKNWEYGPAYLSPVFEFVLPKNTDPTLGQYLLGEVENIEGTLGDIRLEGLGTKLKNSLLLEDGKLYLVISDVRLPGSIIWNGNSSNVWDFANAQNFTLASNPEVTDETFVTGDKVFFGNDASQYTVSLKGELVADSVIVDASRNYVFNGTGSIAGRTKLVKRGRATLTISTDNTYTGGTRISGGTVSVSSLSNANMSYGNLGAVNTTANRFIIENGATLQTTGAVTQGSPMQMLTEDGGVINNSGDFVINSAVMGTKLTKKGSGWMKLNVSNTSLTRLVVAEGTVQCVNCNTPARTVELAGGTLSENTGTSYSIEVTGKKTSYWNLVDRAEYNNRLTGTGTVQIYCPSVVGSGWMATRTPIKGNWSEFEGTVIPAVNSGETRWTLCNSYGMPKGAFNIPEGIVITNMGYTYRVGKVTGTGALGGYCRFDNNGGSGTNTWEVGNDGYFEMQAKVTGGATNFTKVGSGRINLSAQWDNTGNVVINEGEMRMSTSAGMGTGPLTVNADGLLGGTTGTTNLTNSSVDIIGTVRVGNLPTSTSGIINFGGAPVTFQSGSLLQLGINKKATKTATGGTSLGNIGKLTMNGTLEISVSASHTLAEGDSVIVWKAESFSGNPVLLNHVVDAEKGLVWDTTDLRKGILRVKYDPATAVRMLNTVPADTDAPIYSIDGRRMNTSREALRPGIYIQNGRKFLVK